jgi:hypothetical protein
MKTLYYILITVTVIWLLFKLRKLIGHRKIIGRRVTVNYCDQNYHFVTIFPLEGIVTKSIKIGKLDYFIIKLDKSFSYDNNDYDTIVVKESASGQALGISKETKVYVLLPKVKFDKEQYIFEEFEHVVWATVEALG